MEWYWQCLLLPLLYKTGAVLACAMSAMLTWSEVGTGGVWMAASRVQSRDGVVLQCLLLPLLYQTGAVLTCGMSAMLTRSEVGTRHVYSPWMEWYWQCLLLPLLHKTGALLACGMSAMLTWSEVGTCTGDVWMAASRVQSLDGVVLAVSPPPPPLQDGGRARLCHVCHAHLVRGRYSSRVQSLDGVVVVIIEHFLR